MSLPVVKCVSECFVKPKYSPEESKQPIYLAPWDLAMVCVHYIQKGLLFRKPSAFCDNENHQAVMTDYLHKLKESLSLTLVHFYPLAGRLATLKQENPPIYSIYIDCIRSPGARFVHASVDLTIDDILSPTDVPQVVQSFFDHDRATNHDAHTMSLLTIQVTELVDGIFIGCSLNHMAADGTSFWHFFNSWSEVFNAKEVEEEPITISRPPVHQHWFPEGHGPILSLPFTHHDQFIQRHEAPVMRERIFHFSSASLAKLKAEANNNNKAPCNSTNIIVSSLQALSAHIWRCITRARKFPPNQKTSCRMAINNRTRLSPPLPQDYFGNCIQTVRATATSSELLGHNLGWAARQLNQAVANHRDEVVREWIQSWVQSPFIYQLGQFFDPCSIMMGSSPRFNMYGNEFGLGKAIAIRSGYANKFDGKVSLYPGIEGYGTMDLEICLPPHSMEALQSDKEFMDSVSP